MAALQRGREASLKKRQELAKLKKAERDQAESILDAKLKKLGIREAANDDKAKLPEDPAEPVAVVPVAAAKKAKKPKRDTQALVDDILKKAIESDSGDDSDSDDDIQTVSHPLKELYKNKYKNKYRELFSAKQVKQLTKGVAHTVLRTRVDEEMARMASHAIFGS